MSKKSFFGQLCLVVCIVLAGFAGAPSAFAQLGRTITPPASVETESRPNPESNKPADRQDVSAGTLSPVYPTAADVQAMINKIPKPEPVDTAALEERIMAKVRGEMPSTSVLPVVLAVLALIAAFTALIVALTRANRHEVHAVAHSVSSATDNKLDAAVDLMHQLLDQQPEAEDHQWWIRAKEEVKKGPMAKIASLFAMLLFCVFLFPSFAHAQTPTCYNVETGKTPGSKKVAVAIVNARNTFKCSVNGTKVELVDTQDPAKKVTNDPIIKSTSPLEFEFMPTSAGRAIIKVDGKSFNQVAVRGAEIAEAINDAIDLGGGGSSSGIDSIYRINLKFEFDKYCSAKCDGRTAAELYQAATSSAPRTTIPALTILDRAKRQAINDGYAADIKTQVDTQVEAYLRAHPAATQATASSTFDPTPINQRFEKVERGLADTRAEMTKNATAVNEQFTKVGDRIAVSETRLENVTNLIRKVVMFDLSRLSMKGGRESQACQVYRELLKTLKADEKIDVKGGKAEDLDKTCR